LKRKQKISTLLACPLEQVERVYGELHSDEAAFQAFMGKIRKAYDESAYSHYYNRYVRIDRIDSLVPQPLLYIIVRILRPRVVVETGVGNGISSMFLLSALKRNGDGGALYSIDFPKTDDATSPGDTYFECPLPKGKRAGWAVPDELRDAWRIVIDISQNALPKLLNELGEIEMFIHDSKHVYATMMFEYTESWPRIRNGGILFSDDVHQNSAFGDFCRRVDRKPITFVRAGAIRK
jgi:predicted O-methyltransferase YrrM